MDEKEDKSKFELQIGTLSGHFVFQFHHLFTLESPFLEFKICRDNTFLTSRDSNILNYRKELSQHGATKRICFYMVAQGRCRSAQSPPEREIGGHKRNTKGHGDRQFPFQEWPGEIGAAIAGNLASLPIGPHM